MVHNDNWGNSAYFSAAQVEIRWHNDEKQAVATRERGGDRQGARRHRRGVVTGGENNGSDRRNYMLRPRTIFAAVAATPFLNGMEISHQKSTHAVSFRITMQK